MFEVEVGTSPESPRRSGNARPHTLVVDRPGDGGGRGPGFNGGKLLSLAIAEIPNSLRCGTAVRLGSMRVS